MEIRLLLDGLSSADKSAVISGVLETYAALWEAWFRRDPTLPGLDRLGIRYVTKRDPREFWPPNVVLAKRQAACPELAALLAGEIRARGLSNLDIPPGTRAAPYVFWAEQRGGAPAHHAQVRLPDGRILDPSRACGML